MTYAYAEIIQGFWCEFVGAVVLLFLWEVFEKMTAISNIKNNDWVYLLDLIGKQ